MLKKLRSWKAWLATITLVLFVLKFYYKIEIPQADALVNLIMIVGSAWGIWIDVTPRGE